MSEKQTQDYTVSVVIPAYNIGAFICRAIDSALEQKRPADEIIVVDDGSTDDTGEKIKSYGDKVRYIYQENAGLSAARNTGIQAAKSTWIAFLDGDDEWLDEHLLLQMELLENNPDLVWSSTNYIRCLCIEEKQKIDCPVEDIEARLNGKQYYDNYFYAYKNRNAGHPNTMVIRKDVFDTAGMFLVGLRRSEDMDMWFRIAFHWPKIGFVPKPLSIYHLERSGCLSSVFTPADHYIDLINRQCEYAERQGQLEQFKPFAAFLLKLWMRSMLFDARKDDIRKILDEFKELFSPGYITRMHILTACPKLTAAGCRMISKVVRLLNIRKELTRKPR